MGFSQPFSEAHSIQSAIQKHKTDGASDGHSSPILSGTEDQFAGESSAKREAPVVELTPRRTKIHARVTHLVRKYGSTGSGGGNE